MVYYAVVKGRKLGVFDVRTYDSNFGLPHPGEKYRVFNDFNYAVKYCERYGIPVPNGTGRIPIKDDLEHPYAMTKIKKSGSLAECHASCSLGDSLDFTLVSSRLKRLEETYIKKINECENRVAAMEAEEKRLSALEASMSAYETEPGNRRADLRALLQATRAPKGTTLSSDTVGGRTSIYFGAPLNKKAKLSTTLRIGSYDFYADKDGFVKVYIGGVCSHYRSRQHLDKAGVGVWFSENHPLNISKPVAGEKPTKNVADIQAATLAIYQAIEAGVKKICVITDSRFLINCITKWIKTWKKNGWKTRSRDDVKNREQLQALDKMVHYPGVRVKWEKYGGGHTADSAAMLAEDGSRGYVKRNTPPNYRRLPHFELLKLLR